MATARASRPVLELRNLTTTFHGEESSLRAVDGLNLSVNAGDVVGVLGESGCGKSVTFLSALGLISPETATVTGEALFDGRDLLKLSSKERANILGNEIGVIFQEPVATLDPVFTVAFQLAEVLNTHGSLSREQLHTRQLDVLRSMRIPEAERRLSQYAFELSGGMCQRVGIGMAFAHKPRLIIADEPTTALDVTVQAQILRLLVELVRKEGATLIIISHDLGVIAQIATRMVVMYAGLIVEQGSVGEIFRHPRHPYTKRLLRSMPGLTAARTRSEGIPGAVPTNYDRMQGCRFAPRCDSVTAACYEKLPDLVQIDEGHSARCVLVNS